MLSTNKPNTLEETLSKKGTRMSITTGTGWAYVKRLLITANSILSPSYNTYQYFCKAHSRYDLNPARVPILMLSVSHDCINVFMVFMYLKQSIQTFTI